MVKNQREWKQTRDACSEMARGKGWECAEGNGEPILFSWWKTGAPWLMEFRVRDDIGNPLRKMEAAL